MNHLETSIPGLAVILCGVILLVFVTTDAQAVISGSACIAAGIGLLRAADANRVKGGNDGK